MRYKVLEKLIDEECEKHINYIEKMRQFHLFSYYSCLLNEKHVQNRIDQNPKLQNICLSSINTASTPPNAITSENIEPDKQSVFQLYVFFKTKLS